MAQFFSFSQKKSPDEDKKFEFAGVWKNPRTLHVRVEKTGRVRERFNSSRLYDILPQQNRITEVVLLSK